MKRILILALFALIGSGFGVQHAKAQEIAPQPCDPIFYEQMRSKAWLETQREITQNQNLIFKSDSVFDYSCFDQFAKKVAYEGGFIFTHTDFFDGPIITRGNAGSVHRSIQRIVFDSVHNFRNSNFDHSWLGGRGHYPGIDLLDGPQTKELHLVRELFDPAADTSSAYACGVMAQVWEKAKCLNFIGADEFKDSDGYYPIKTIEAFGEGAEIEGYDTFQDVRKFPPEMPRCGRPFAVTYEAEVPKSINVPEIYDYQTPLGEVFLDVLDKTFPGLCGKAGIKTGVTVILADGPAHEDGVCTNPGCTYQESGTCS